MLVVPRTESDARAALEVAARVHKVQEDALRAEWAKGTREFAVRFRHFSLEPSWFHELWYEAYDDPALTRVFLQAPREHAKTSTVLTYVARRLCEDHRLRVGIVSGADDLAKKFLNEVKHELTTNEELRRIYGVRPGPKWTEHELVLADARQLGLKGKDVNLFSVGRGSQISSRHCDLLIVDDIESRDSVQSDLVRASTREWWAREVVPVLSPGGKLIALGTRKHFDDLYSYWIAGRRSDERPEGWVILDQARRVWREPDAYDAGTPIWPEFWSESALRARKAELDDNDLLAWPQEYLNEPRPAGTQMFFPEKWPTYSRAPHGLTYFQFWDLAISEKTTADYTVGWTIGVDERNTAFLLERRRGHWDFNRTLAEIEDMGQRWVSGLSLIGIEEVAYQAAAVQESMRRTMLPIVPVRVDRPAGDKVIRARLLEARAAAGRVYRPVIVDDTVDPPVARDPEWWSSFANEATFFPVGAHDDQVDALSGAFRLVGWDANTTAWALGVYSCANCGHPFTWAAGRPCPKCGTHAPATYDNPEGFGLATVADSSGTAIGGEVPEPALPSPAALQPLTAAAPLGWQEQEIADKVTSGEYLAFRSADWPAKRMMVSRVASWLSETGQLSAAMHARDEVERLDRELGYTNGH